MATITAALGTGLTEKVEYVVFVSDGEMYRDLPHLTSRPQIWQAGNFLVAGAGDGTVAQHMREMSKYAGMSEVEEVVRLIHVTGQGSPPTDYLIAGLTREGLALHVYIQNPDRLEEDENWTKESLGLYPVTTWTIGDEKQHQLKRDTSVKDHDTILTNIQGNEGALQGSYSMSLRRESVIGYTHTQHFAFVDEQGRAFLFPEKITSGDGVIPYMGETLGDPDIAQPDHPDHREAKRVLRDAYAQLQRDLQARERTKVGYFMAAESFARSGGSLDQVKQIRSEQRRAGHTLVDAIAAIRARDLNTLAAYVDSRKS